MLLSQSGRRDEKALHVLPADERDMLAEFLLIKLDQPVAMAVLFVVHGHERLGRFGIIAADALGKVGVNAAVLLLVLDREREHFPRGKFFQCFRHVKPLAANLGTGRRGFNSGLPNPVTASSRWPWTANPR